MSTFPALANAEFGMDGALLDKNYDDYLAWLLWLVPRIDAYIEACEINGPYWAVHHDVLRRFSDRCERLCDLNKLVAHEPLTPLQHCYRRVKGLLASKQS